MQLWARLTWRLSGSGRTALAELSKLPEPKRHFSASDVGRALADGGVHRTAEWPADKPRQFHEAPMLAEQVAAGELPPVNERLPENPLVIIPPEQCGPYGGTWDRYNPTTQLFLTPRIGYDNYARFGPMGREILPNLATDWKTLDDGRTWIIHLRKGVRWSDGHPCTADDIVFWHDDMLRNTEITPRPEDCYCIGGKLVEVEKIDDYTIRVTYGAPNGRMLSDLTEGALRPVPSHYIKTFHPKYASAEHMRELVAELNVAGPYVAFQRLWNWGNHWELPSLSAWISPEEITPGKPAVWVRNPYYWKVDPNGNQLPYIDRIVFHLAGDAQTITLKAINGQVGMQALYMKVTDYPLLMEKSHQSHQPGSNTRPFSIRHWLGPNTVKMMLNLNHRDPVMNELVNDRRFRMALSLAINREEINEVQFYGLGRPRQNSPTAMSRYYSEALENAYIQYDPETANALLDEMGLTRRDGAGYRLRPDGKVLTMRIESNQSTGYEDALQLVARYWRDVGIKADLSIQALTLWRERYLAGLHDVYAWWYNQRQIPWTGAACPAGRYSPQARLWGRWYGVHIDPPPFKEMDSAEPPVRPPAAMERIMRLWKTSKHTPDEATQIKLFDEIHRIKVEQAWDMLGLVGEVPVLVVAQDRFKNVPQLAYFDWYCRGPGNTAVECYAIDTDEE